MHPVFHALLRLAPERDAEILEGFQRYAAALDGILTPEQINLYSDYLRRTHQYRILETLSDEDFKELSQEEQQIANIIIADMQACNENRRVAALLLQRDHVEFSNDVGQLLSREVNA